MARTHGWPLISFLASFGASKLLVVLGPILLAKLYAPNVYGMIELAMSTSLFLATVATGAITSAVPRLHLSRSPVAVDDITAATVATVGGILLALAFAVFTRTGQAPAALCLLATIPAILQGALSVHFQVAHRRNVAVIASCFATITATATALALMVVRVVTGELVLTIYAAVGACIAALALYYAITRLRPGFVARCRRVLNIGVPILMFGLVAAWFAASGRVYIANYFSIEAVAVYSVDFRVAAMAQLPLLLVTSGFYSRIFMMRTRPFDRIAPIYLGFGALLGFGLAIRFPALLAGLAPKALNAEQRELACSVFPMVMGQVIGGTISASIFMRVHRAGLAWAAAKITGAIAVLCALCLYAVSMRGTLSLTTAVLFVMLQEFAQVFSMLWLLWRRKRPLPRLACFAGTVCVVAVLTRLLH